MSSPKEFREFALECMRRAQATSDPKERQALLEMAARWMRAAVRVERSSIDLLDDGALLPGEDVPLAPSNDET